MKVADILKKSGAFKDFDTQPFTESIDMEVLNKYGWSVDRHANNLLDKMYTYADRHSIWID